MSIWIAEYSSSHFSFTAAGTDRDKAINAMISTLDMHGRQMDCEDEWWYVSDINAYEVTLNGLGVRDASYPLADAMPGVLKEHIEEESSDGCDWDDCPLGVCEWCNSAGCQSCGYTGHKLDEETGEPILPTGEEVR